MGTRLLSRLSESQSRSSEQALEHSRLEHRRDSLRRKKIAHMVLRAKQREQLEP